MDEKPYNESTLAVELDNLKGSNVYLWLQDLLRVNAKNITVLRDDTQLRWLQGQAQQLGAIITAIDEAAEKAWSERETERRHADLKQLRNKTF